MAKSINVGRGPTRGLTNNTNKVQGLQARHDRAEQLALSVRNKFENTGPAYGQVTDKDPACNREYAINAGRMPK